LPRELRTNRPIACESTASLQPDSITILIINSGRARSDRLHACMTSSAATPPLPTDASQQVQPPDLSQASILLVDDNLQNLELMQAYLEGLPCRTRAARDGVEAMEMIEEECPDLVLLDVMMPRMSGFEVCQKIKANPATRDVVVIMVTALHEIGDYERAVDCGTTDFITKPVNKVELLTRVRSLLELRLVKKRYDQLMGLKQHRQPDDRERPGAGENLE
jgi:two-component system alkaline phosphatase synthesis response regulator PhoP